MLKNLFILFLGVAIGFCLALIVIGLIFFRDK